VKLLCTLSQSIIDWSNEIFFIFWSSNSFLVIKYFDCKIDGQLLSFCWPREKLKVGPIWKRHKKWVVHSKLAWKVQFSPLIFHIILIRSLEFVAIQFWYKRFIFIIFQSLVQKRRERYHRVQVLREKVIIHIIVYHQNSCYLCLWVPCDEMNLMVII